MRQSCHGELQGQVQGALPVAIAARAAQNLVHELPEEAAVTRRGSGALERYVFDLSTTEWAEMPACDVVSAAVFAARGSLNGYPDHSAARVRELLAERHGLRPDQFVLGNGAGNLLQTAALTLLSPSDDLVTPWPSYPLYPLMARRAGARPVPVALADGRLDLETLLAAVNDRTRVLVICNPNDPTGTYLESAMLAELLSRLPERVHLLLDEAIVHFQDIEDEDACLRLVEEFPRLVVFRSFSNAYGLSGLRAGYAVGSAEAAHLLDSLAPVLGVNALTQAAVECALQRGDAELSRRREMVIAQRDRLHDAVAALPISMPQSEAHFVWMQVSGMTGLQLAAAFQRAGVVVFPGSVLGDGEHVRIALKSAPATDRLLTVLAEIASATACGDLVESAA
jgi:histidinol-phosphate aminotransferase